MPNNTPDFHSTDPAEMRRIEAWCAEHVMGWRWYSFLSIPVKGTPGYPGTMRVRQFFSKAQLNNPKWQEFVDRSSVQPATGDEPLSYDYCSFGSTAAGIPNYLTDANADVAVLQYVRENWPREQFHHFQGAFVELGNEDPCHYDIGDYCRAACITKSENKP